MTRIVNGQVTTEIICAKPLTTRVEYHSKGSAGSVVAYSEASIFTGEPLVRLGKRDDGVLDGIDQYMFPADAKRFGQGLIDLAEGMGA